ncbi:MAG: serine/threonine-protein kinase [Planctomycetota bacterium]|nr:serine/threonine-protein kinase [Planctomycetota bacterium]
MHAALERAIRLRNSVIHEHRLEARAEARKAVRSAMDHAAELRFQAIVVPRALEDLRGAVRVYRAACYRGLSMRHPVTIETDVDLVPRRAYLAIEGHSRLLPLHPLVVEGESCAGGRLPELYAVRDLGRLSVRSVALGRDAPAAVRALIQDALPGLEERAVTWVAPRHFACPSLTVVAARRLGPGDTVSDHYAIQRYLGSGRTSDVYEAIAPDGVPVALKLIAADIAAEAQTLDRFRREVAALRRIRHRNVLRYVDDGEDAGARYVVTELANGWSLDGELARDAAEFLAVARSRGSTGLDEETVRGIAIDVAAGLAELHENGLVHRDVKLSNVLLFETGGDRRAVLGDLGIARGFGASSLTHDGLPIGTPEAMAPECGETQEAEPTIDVYAFGILLYEALAGAPPFRGSTAQETRAKHRTRLPPLGERAPHVSEGLANLVRQCLAKNPASRPKHGADLYGRLQRLHDATPDAPRTVDIVRGQRLGHYAVHEPVGELPGATLFRAIDDRTLANVRVGILDDALENDEARRTRTMAVLAKLQSSSCETLVRLREYGEGDGYTWFLIEDAAPLVLGGAQPLDVVSTLDVIAGAARALGALHRAGMTHGRVESSIRFHPPTAAAHARALVELPLFDDAGGGGAAKDTHELVTLAQRTLEASVAPPGHARRARARAQVALIRLARGGQATADEWAAWADSFAAEVRDASWAGRALRAIRRRRRSVAILIGIAAMTFLGVWLRANQVERLRQEAADMELEVDKLVRASRYCLALRRIDSSPDAAARVPVLSGRRSILAIQCASESEEPRPGFEVLDGLARAAELPERKRALADVERNAGTIVDWARERLESGEVIPDHLAHAFWLTTATAIGEAYRLGEPLERLEALFAVAEPHFRDRVSARARNQIDVCTALRLKILEERASTSEEAARAAIDLADASLSRPDRPWNEYTLECYRALCLADLATKDPAFRERACHILRELANPERRDAGFAQAIAGTDRDYEPGYRTRNSLHGIDLLFAQCSSAAANLGCP